jgi:hypothetical protein
VSGLTGTIYPTKLMVMENNIQQAREAERIATAILSADERMNT